jgi:Peptidase_C39 like family
VSHNRDQCLVLLSLFVMGSLALAAGGCGLVGGHPDVKLGVPYRGQDPNSFGCGPASVLMWRLYDGLPEISQQTIGDWMGGTSCGVSQQDIADAVNHFTLTSDAYWDLAGDVEYEAFFSRQITSLDTGVPVIAILDGGLHAGVVNGGKWHVNANGDYQWDYVYFHDPATFANDYYSANLWQNVNCPAGSTCEQIASYGASAAWMSNLSTYGNDVVAGGGGIPPPDERQ